MYSFISLIILFFWIFKFLRLENHQRTEWTSETLPPILWLMAIIFPNLNTSSLLSRETWLQCVFYIFILDIFFHKQCMRAYYTRHIIIKFTCIFQVPHDFDILQTIDLLFKVHLMFDSNFDPSLKNMFNFLQFFVYEIKSKNVKPTTGMKDIFNKLCA